MARNERNPNNNQNQLFKSLTRIFSGPLTLRRTQSGRQLRRRHLDIYAKRFKSASGQQFKKTEFLALVYQFNQETGSFDDDGIPELEETTTFTVDEVFYKLNRLKEKVKNEFLPINVQIKDVIGEFLYFQKITIKFWRDDTPILDMDMNEFAEVQLYPSLDANLIIRSLDPLFKKVHKSGADFGTVQLNLNFQDPYQSNQRYPVSQLALSEMIQF